MSFVAGPSAEDEAPFCRTTILIVEDHAPTGKALRLLLASSLPGCDLRVVDTAETALELCAIDPPDLVIMDISLPGMNGMAATHRIKALSRDTLVVMHTSNDSWIFQEESILAGASAFVSKRDTPTELVPVVIRLLSLGHAAGAADGHPIALLRWTAI